MSQTPEKSIVQVPDSSPSPKYTHTHLFKEKPIVSKNNLKEKFAFNGFDLMKKKQNYSVRDLEILKKLFPTVSDNLIKVVYSQKANSDLKAAKIMLTGVVEKRKQGEMISRAKQNLQKSQEAESPKKKKTFDEIEISSSPEVSPKKSISSKVVLEKKQTISEKYSHNFKQQEKPSEVDDEPLVKKRRLVKGSRNKSPSPTLKIESDAKNFTKKNIIDLSDEEEVIHDDLDSDSEVEETTLNNNEGYYQDKVLDFFNTVEDRDIVDVTSCELALAQNIIEKRPFRSINHFESLNFNGHNAKVRRNRKTDGEILSQKAELVLRGYNAVETLVKKCNTYSEQIATEINKWGVKVLGVTDELEIVDVNLSGDEDDSDEEINFGSKKLKYIKEKPKLLADDVDLKNYQQVGLNWLNLLYKNKLSCILADEMGLGKTCQVIAFLSLLKQQDIRGPHLIVVPSSTLENWMREFNKFAPSLVIEPYYGSQADREEMREVLTEKMTEIDVIVTTYNLATGSKDDQSFLKHAGFNVVVYDEGHMLKNSSSERFQKLMKIKSKFRLLLTGTPLQNNLRELMSLLEFILPSLFVSQKEDLKYVFSQKATTQDNKKGYNPLLSDRAISSAKKMMAPFILRRRKDQVLQHLPQKHNSISICSMTEKQKEIYMKEVSYGKELRESKKSKLANILMNLRKAAIHPLLFRSIYDDEMLQKMSKEIMREEVYRDANREFIFEDMQVMNDFELNNLCVKFPSIGKYQLQEEEFLKSGKVVKLKELLDHMFKAENGKILIFSLFTQVLDILEHVLSSWSIKFLRLDGSTAVDIRQDIIDKFYQEDTIPVFLLSTKAGGFGINLVCANNVIIFDQSFNPHDDKQAEDRAHRVGQEREVNVIRIISRETIEENMYQVAQNKLELDQSMSGEQIESKALSFIDQMIFTENAPKIELLDNTVIKSIKEEDEREIATESPTPKLDSPDVESIKSETPNEVISNDFHEKENEPIMID
jgi:SWI/SNF-related matrix-associated actin-dependent regulator 1 of chromatin subfamily A